MRKHRTIPSFLVCTLALGGLLFALAPFDAHGLTSTGASVEELARRTALEEGVRVLGGGSTVRGELTLLIQVMTGEPA